MDTIARARVIAAIVATAARHNIYHPNCLPRSLVLQRMLLSEGLRADLRFGVRKAEDGTLDAHAWIEHDGQPLIDDPDVHQQFKAFGRPPQSEEGVPS